jgi:DNA-damage-inducible protein J
MTNINISVDSEVKKEAQIVFEELGLDMDTAINVFLKQSIKERALPFYLRAEREENVPKLGIMKGKIWMADDFDAPLEEFKEYMP